MGVKGILAPKGNFSSILGKRHQAQNGVTCAKPHNSSLRLNPDLIAVSTTPGNLTFNQSTWNYLVSTSEVIAR